MSWHTDTQLRRTHAVNHYDNEKHIVGCDRKALRFRSSRPGRPAARDHESPCVLCGQPILAGQRTQLAYNKGVSGSAHVWCGHTPGLEFSPTTPPVTQLSNEEATQPHQPLTEENKDVVRRSLLQIDDLRGEPLATFCLRKARSLKCDPSTVEALVRDLIAEAPPQAVTVTDHEGVVTVEIYAALLRTHLERGSNPVFSS